MKLWGGRFTKPTHRLVEEFNASIPFDYRLAEEDIQGSMAHVTMLAACGIISKQEMRQMIAGLETIQQKIRAGKISFAIEQEDIHLNLEKMLIDEIGPVGGKVHTGRSRNDQVALDLHLYLRKQVLEVMSLLVQLQQVLLERAEQHLHVLLPGYTHLQRAQPVRFSHHLLAYVSMLERDVERLRDSYQRVNTCPLGAGALAGTSFPIDRHLVADQLAFTRIYDNSMDAVSDRDDLIEFCSNTSLIMVHLSRLAEELILWSSEEFAFITLDDAYCTGSSMMPQKKNPDIPELIRGKTGRVFGHLIALLTLFKALPLTYNKDYQEDKEALFDTVATVKNSLTLMALLLKTVQVHEGEMRKKATAGFMGATDIADYLVKQGMPFREAHEVVGRLVRRCIEQNKTIAECSLAELKEESPLFEMDVFALLSCEAIVNARQSFGGTAEEQVRQTMNRKREKIAETLSWLLQVGKGNME
jgi:argininosuccinate lyase